LQIRANKTTASPQKQETENEIRRYFLHYFALFVGMLLGVHSIDAEIGLYWDSCYLNRATNERF